jgi:hypothetical protein
VFPGGTEIGLEIHSALCECKEIELHSAGIEVSNHAPYVFARHDFHPGVAHPNWISGLNRIIRTRKIDFVFPAHDDVTVALAEARGEIEAKVLCSPLETCRLSRSKTATYRHLAGHVATPRIYEHADRVTGFPVFVKPDRGQGSQGARVVSTREELRLMEASEDEPIILEFLPGDEYTIDCFSDRERGLLFCSGRQRDRVRSGISVATHRVDDPRFRQIAEKIGQRMAFHGAWFFQLKKDGQGELKLLEVAPRIAGAMALHRVAGVNFPLLTLFEALRRPLEIYTNALDTHLDRALINRYSAHPTIKNVYVDLDDTLLVREIVSLPVIRFLYQSLNKGARLVLITRHAGELEETLRKHRLSELFDRVVQLAEGQPKSSAIDDGRDAVMIDDSFHERKEVHEKTGILTFDNSMIEALQDYRS